jgi:arginine/ornithine N-succinyltransferase beta subunit
MEIHPVVQSDWEMLSECAFRTGHGRPAIGNAYQRLRSDVPMP